jgi:putative FmdB family regulatory protein
LPLYEYECPKCGTFELVRKFSDAPLESCPTCAQPVEKLASAPAIQFKGTGWYITDYARKSSGAEGGKEAKDKAAAKEGSKESSPSPASESKSSTPETKSSSSGSGDKK